MQEALSTEEQAMHLSGRLEDLQWPAACDPRRIMHVSLNDTSGFGVTVHLLAQALSKALRYNLTMLVDGKWTYFRHSGCSTSARRADISVRGFCFRALGVPPLGCGRVERHVSTMRACGRACSPVAARACVRARCPLLLLRGCGGCCAAPAHGCSASLLRSRASPASCPVHVPERARRVSARGGGSLRPQRYLHCQFPGVAFCVAILLVRDLSCLSTCVCARLRVCVCVLCVCGYIFLCM
jgi:hypothetical protein